MLYVAICVYMCLYVYYMIPDIIPDMCLYDNKSILDIPHNI
uniref:Uncharacterized protein n=1 Tax=viral metagenome TaxID=1070528 RepID=A0A6C0CE28_9ZZZZ